MRAVLLAPPARNPFTGGHLYNHQVAVHLASDAGFELRTVPTERFAAELDALAAFEDVVAVVDSLFLEQLATRNHPRPRVILLLHFLPDDDPTGPAAANADRTSRFDRALATATGILVTSKYMADTVRRRANQVPVRVCLPGVEPPLDRLPPSAAVIPRILTVANFEPRKGQVELLDVLARLTDRAWHWDIVGDPEADPAYAATFRANLRTKGLAPRATVHGALTPVEVARRFARADLFALLTRYEPYGMVFAEAITHGVPVVAYRVGGVPESVDHDDTGLLAEVGDLDTVTQHLRLLLDSPPRRAAMRRAAVAQRARFPTWQQCSARLWQCLGELAGSPTGG